jgi:hypothetical protein
MLALRRTNPTIDEKDDVDARRKPEMVVAQ